MDRQADVWISRQMCGQAAGCEDRQAVVWAGTCCVDRQVYVRTGRKIFGMER